MVDYYRLSDGSYLRAEFGIDLGLQRICPCGCGNEDDTEGKQGGHSGFAEWPISSHGSVALLFGLLTWYSLYMGGTAPTSADFSVAAIRR